MVEEDKQTESQMITDRMYGLRSTYVDRIMSTYRILSLTGAEGDSSRVQQCMSMAWGRRRRCKTKIYFGPS